MLRINRLHQGSSMTEATWYSRFIIESIVCLTAITPSAWAHYYVRLNRSLVVVAKVQGRRVPVGAHLRKPALVRNKCIMGAWDQRPRRRWELHREKRYRFKQANRAACRNNTTGSRTRTSGCCQWRHRCCGAASQPITTAIVQDLIRVYIHHTHLLKSKQRRLMGVMRYMPGHRSGLAQRSPFRTYILLKGQSHVAIIRKMGGKKKAEERKGPRDESEPTRNNDFSFVLVLSYDFFFGRMGCSCMKETDSIEDSRPLRRTNKDTVILGTRRWPGNFEESPFYALCYDRSPICTLLASRANTVDRRNSPDLTACLERVHKDGCCLSRTVS